MALTYVKSSGLDTTGDFVANSLTLTSNVVSGNANLGNAVTANYFIGNGSQLTGLPAGYTDTNANSAIDARVTKTFVDNLSVVANIANVAYSVAVANVTDIGNIATLNLDGNASTILYGNGVFAAAPTGTGGGGGTTFVSVADTFTGDGTTTAFTLSTTPAGAEYTIVTIGGVSQPRSSYSCIGTTLTFLSAPPANTVIEVTSMGGAATALGTASTVTSGYQPNIISVGTLVSLNVSGNITSNNIVGNLTGIATSSQTVLTNSQPNITSVGTLANLTVTGNITTSGKFIGDGSGISNIATAQQVSSSSQPNITSVGTLTELNIAGAFSSSSFSEPVSVKSNAVGTVTHNFSDSSTFVHLTPSANFTVNVTNVPTTDNRIVVVALIIYQGATAFIPSGFQLDGFSFTPKWVNGVAPVGTANKVDVFSYSILRYNGTWDIYGQISTYGVV